MNVALYYAPNTCALAPFVTLTEAGAEFTPRAVNMRKRQHMSPEYLELNPKHKVPVLVVDGKPLTENVAIQVWINRTFPDANLLPKTPWDEVKAISLLAWCASGIHPHLSRINNPSKFCDMPEAEDGVRRIAVEQLFETFALADRMLAGRAFFFDYFTAPDAHFFWCFRRASQFDLDLSAFGNCAAHFERMKTRASVQKLFAYEKQVQAEFARTA